MALHHHPKRWEVLQCDFSTGFIVPEMVKGRLVVVVSEELDQRPDLCTIVPLSATEPYVLKPYHHEMSAHSLPKSYRNMTMWAKCDMINTVALKRLDRVKLGKDRKTGKRIYHSGTIILEDIQGIRAAILHALKMETLTEYL